jgi:hypothetical protein
MMANLSALKKYFALNQAQSEIHSIGDFWKLSGIPTAVVAFLGLLFVVWSKWEIRKLANFFFTGHLPSARQSESDRFLFLIKLKQYKVKVIGDDNNNCGFLKVPVKGERAISNIIM